MYKKDLNDNMNLTVRKLFNLKREIDSVDVDCLLSKNLLSIKSEFYTENNTLYRRCVCTNKLNNNSSEFTVKVSKGE